MTTKTARHMAIDWLRLLLAGFVVLAHSGLGRETVGMADLSAGNAMLRVAVPAFTLIAGFFLENVLRRRAISRWAGGLLTIYAIWSLAYLLFLAPYYAGRPPEITLRELLTGFMHLWFLMGLALAGMMLAAFRRFGRAAVVLSAIAFGLLGLWLQRMRMHGMPIELELYRNGPLYLYPYLVMGWLISLAPRDRLPGLPVLGVALAAGLALTMYETGFWLQRLGEEPLLEMPLGHLLMCPALFMLVLRMPMPRTCLPLGRAAAGIYVLHVFLLQGLPMLGVEDLATRAVAGFLVPFALVVGASALSARMPFLSRLF